MDSVAMVWVSIGAVLILLELVVPGAVFGFVGGAAVLTGVLVQLGHIEGPVNILLTFFVSSIFFVLVLRTGLLKLFPSDDRVENTDETEDAKGKIVDVLEEITPYRRGRIRYLGTTWDAQCDTHLEAGSQAVIAGRDGNCWIVKSL